VVIALAACKRERRHAVPGLAGEGNVEGDSPASDNGREVAVHVDQSAVRDSRGYFRAELALGVGSYEVIDAVDDTRIRFRESFAKRGIEILVLCRTRSAVLSEHPSDRSIPRATVGDGSNLLDDLEQPRGDARIVAVRARCWRRAHEIENSREVRLGSASLK
jgi:hypothetical protein